MSSSEEDDFHETGGFVFGSVDSNVFFDAKIESSNTLIESDNTLIESDTTLVESHTTVDKITVCEIILEGIGYYTQNIDISASNKTIETETAHVGNTNSKRIFIIKEREDSSSSDVNDKSNCCKADDSVTDTEESRDLITRSPSHWVKARRPEDSQSNGLMHVHPGGNATDDNDGDKEERVLSDNWLTLQMETDEMSCSDGSTLVQEQSVCGGVIQPHDIPRTTPNELVHSTSNSIHNNVIIEPYQTNEDRTRDIRAASTYSISDIESVIGPAFKKGSECHDQIYSQEVQKTPSYLGNNINTSQCVKHIKEEQNGSARNANNPSLHLQEVPEYSIRTENVTSLNKSRLSPVHSSSVNSTSSNSGTSNKPSKSVLKNLEKQSSSDSSYSDTQYKDSPLPVQQNGNARRSKLDDPTQPSIQNIDEGTSDAYTHLISALGTLGSSTSSIGETTPLLSDGRLRVYRRRWYVLGLFCLSSFMQGLAWGTWGPITQSLKWGFGWTDSSLALIQLWGNLAYVMLSIPACIFIEKTGMRVSMVMAQCLITLGFGLRCISSNNAVFMWSTNIGQYVLGAGALVPFSAVSLLSSIWFPQAQRTIATSIAFVVGYVGVAAGFVIGPMFVPEPMFANNSSTLSIADTWDSFVEVEKNCTNIQDMKDTTMKLLYYEAAANAAILLMFIVYFPAKPPTPPSLTAQIERLSIKEGVKSLMRNKQFLICLAAYSIGTGVYGAWGVILDIDLQPSGVSQDSAGWMGFYATIAGCVAGLVFSWLSDMFSRRLQTLLLVMLLPSVATLIWFSLMVDGTVSASIGAWYVAVIVPGFFVYGTSPLFYELSCEAAYPTGEGITTLVLTVFNNIIGIVFLGVLMVKNIGVSWMNWLLVGSVGVSAVLLMGARVQYSRTNIDLEITVDKPEEDKGGDQPGHHVTI